MDNTNVGHLHPKTCLDPSDKSELSWLTIVLEYLSLKFAFASSIA